MAELYEVKYRGINLYSYEMTKQEAQHAECLRQKAIQICSKFEVPEMELFDGNNRLSRFEDYYDFKIKYINEIGYCVLTGERGRLSFLEGFPTKVFSEALVWLLRTELSSVGVKIELRKRRELSEEWERLYKTRYDSRKYRFEYILSVIYRALNKHCDVLIKKYTDLLNINFNYEYWGYNKSTLTFEPLNAF